MRIGIDVSAAQRRHGGISQYARRLLEALIRLQPTDDFFLFSTHDLRAGTIEPLPPLPANFTLYPLRFPGRILKHSWRYLGWPTATSVLPPVDVFFAPHIIVPPGRFPRLVVTVHDMLFEDHPEWFPADANRYRAALRNAIQRADALISVSQFTKDQLINQLGVPPDRITVIPSGVDPAKATAADWERAKRRHSLPDSYLLMLGTVEDRKNVAGVLRAYRELLLRQSVPPLVVAGAMGQLDPVIRADLDRLTKSHQLFLTSQFADADRAAILSHAKVLLFPSLAEGFGLPVLEGFAAGVPVLTSTTTSLPEVAGTAALLVDPLDHAAIAKGIVQLIDDSDLRKQLIEAGRQRATQFTWQKTAQTTLDLIKRVATT